MSKHDILIRRRTDWSHIMKITGIIAEYNPFHNGHKYHLDQAREMTGADFLIVVMSGNFMQRGTPAIIDKYTRTEMALRNGADLVLELPVYYATGSAEYFASGSVGLLDKLGVVDSLCFGSECNDISRLSNIATLLLEEPLNYKERLRSYLRMGLSFPSARDKVFSECYPEDASIMNMPNNILAIEYIKALFKRKSPIIPYSIGRQGSGYNELQLNSQGNFSSATAIRHAITSEAGLYSIKNQVPETVFSLLVQASQTNSLLDSNSFSSLLRYQLLSETAEGLTRYVDINQDLAYKIINHLNSFTTIDAYCSILKSKELTHTRISRALLHILLQLKNDQLATFVEADYLSYARILGFRKSSASLLSHIKEKARIPLISKLADTSKILDFNSLQMLEHDIFASHVYSTIVTDINKSSFKNEYSQPIIIL